MAHVSFSTAGSKTLGCFGCFCLHRGCGVCCLKSAHTATNAGSCHLVGTLNVVLVLVASFVVVVAVVVVAVIGRPAVAVAVALAAVFFPFLLLPWCSIPPIEWPTEEMLTICFGCELSYCRQSSDDQWPRTEQNSNIFKHFKPLSSSISFCLGCKKGWRVSLIAKD